MGGTWATGDWNIAHTPAAWELMFDAVPLDNLGLELKREFICTWLGELHHDYILFSRLHTVYM